MNNTTLKYNAVATFILVVIFFILSTFTTQLADPTHYTLNKTSAVYSEQAYLVDETEALSLKQFLTKTKINQPFDTINWHFGQQDYWLQLTLNNKQNKAKDIVIHFDNPMVDKLTVYQLDQRNQLIKTSQLGDKIPGLSRLQYSIPHLKATLAPQSLQKIIIKVDTQGISKTPVRVYGTHEFQDLVRSLATIWGAFIGVLIMAALYNLILFFGIRDRVYLVYIGYIIFALILLGSVRGFGFYLWPMPWQLFFNQYIVFSNYALAFFTVAFCTMFLRYDKDKCILFRVSQTSLVLLFTLGLASFFIPEYYSAPVFFVIMILLYVLCFMMIYNKIVSGFRWTKYYVFSWIPLLLGAAIQPLELTGVLPYSFTTRHFFLLAILCEVTMMAMALADRVRFQREKALYHATHTEHTKLLNKAVLKKAFFELTKSGRHFSICIIQITNYNPLTQLLTPGQYSQLINAITNALESRLANLREFYLLEANLEANSKVADLGDGRLALISTKNQTKESLQAQLHTLINTLPKRQQITGLDLVLDYSLSIQHLDTEQSFDTSLQRAFMGLSFSATQERTQPLSIETAAALQHAIRNNKVALFLQPIIDIKTQQVVTAEALFRWPNNPHNANIEQLIQLAEITGVVNELTVWVIDTACAHLASLNAQLPYPISISINLSAKNTVIPNLIEKVENAMLKHGISAKQLIFELTESALIEKPNEMKTLTQSLLKLGCRLWLDDFGTGYSSLNYLRSYQFNGIKLDKSYVHHLDQPGPELDLVKAIIGLAHNLDLKITVEGVEDLATANLLGDLKANHLQGFYYSRPLALPAFIDWVKSQ